MAHWLIANKAGREKWDPAETQGKNIPHTLSFADTLGSTCIMQDYHSYKISQLLNAICHTQYPSEKFLIIRVKLSHFL